jgi:Na+/proline symporter
VLLSKIPLTPAEIAAALQEPVNGASRLTILRTALDPSKPGLGFDASQPYTLLTAIFGFSLLNLAAYGTDHDLTQRMLTCRSALKGGSSAFIALLINLPMLAVFMSIGLLLYLFYQRPDLMGAAAPGAAPARSRDVFLVFIMTQMPPGLTGLMMAGLFAVGVGSLNSALAAMSATFINDAYRPMVRGRTDRHYLIAGRLAVAAWGVVLGLFACWCVLWHARGGETLIGFVLGAMTFAYAGLLGVFLTALCTRRGNAKTAIIALAVGFLAVLLMQPAIWAWWTQPLPSLAAVKLAFPWRLTIATILAFLACVSGRPARPASMP